MKPERSVSAWVRTLVCLGCLSGALTAQGFVLALEGEQEGPVQLPIAEQALMTMGGPANMPLALIIGFEAAIIPTPYGVLEVNAFQPEAFLILNGFDATHYNFSVSQLDAAGNLSAFVVPFTDPNMTPGFTLYTQAVVQDPSSPAGFTLSNPLEIEAVAIPPIVHLATPNFGAAGQIVTLLGNRFDSEPQENEVFVDGRQCSVSSGTENTLVGNLPLDARSGPVTVSNSAGTSVRDIHSIDKWMAVITTPVAEGSEPAIITTPVTIQGHIQFPGQRDAYVVRATAGQEIFAEVYSWDPNTQRITSIVNTVNTYFDPVVRLKRSGITLVEDDDSGPQFNAAIGLADGASFFVADQAGDYVIEVDTFLSSGTGAYLLILGARFPENMPPTVQTVIPSVSQVGSLVRLHVTGVDPAQPALHSVLLDGQSIAPQGVGDGFIDFIVPAGVVSGPVNIVTPVGNSSHDVNRMSSWLVVMGSLIHIEDENKINLTIQPGESVMGALGTSSDTDPIYFNATVGQRFRIECTAFDPASGAAVTAGFLTSTPLDPEIRVASALHPNALIGVDTNGGPGYNALLGEPSAGQSFVIPSTATYVIRISSWFSLSSGSYVLNLVEITGS